jgi:predicted nucleotidyltransferase
LSTGPLRLRELLQRLVEAEVSFILVGGLAVNAWGYMRGPQDVDVVPDPDPENLAKLDGLLQELGGRVDVGGRLLDIDGLPVRVCSLEHLLEMKRASDRARDHDDILELEAAQEPGGEQS